MDAAISRSNQRASELSRLHAIGQGPLDTRIDEFVAMRLRLHDAIGPVYRATVANAARLPRIRDELARSRNEMRAQFERQFDPELTMRKSTDREAVLAAGDLLTQLDSIELLRRHRRLSVAETRSVLVAALHALLA